ncbi:glycosyltransferase [Cytobacillus oceanisediminis]|uniref:Glycosyltransferase n=1 Tax=Cytobacillus oceanisediminis 2691 TaxID=1196031 RepID=A0A160MG54_9BACI|nr:glycosyltransferase [Cytobacillus oceanisediminis]AND42259.1 hypothetical protein A361_24950 [Cytobacillus oceanisediminis 2691]
MKKICYVVSTLKKSGPTNQLYNIINNLPKDIFEPMVITLSSEPEETDIQKFKDAKIPVISLGLSRLGGVIKGSRSLLKLVKEYQPDVVHTQGIRSDTLSSRYLKGYKRVATLRNYPYEDYPMTYGKFLGQLMAWQHIKALKQIDNPVACSNTIYKLLKKHGLELKVVQNGVDTNKFSSVSEIEKTDLREKLGLPKNKRIFISVGHLSARKDPITVIEGFQKSNFFKNSILLFLGEGTLIDECRERIKNTTNIQLLGRKRNVDEYLKSADYFVSASLSEGLPNSVLEALASGIPVCLSDIDQHQEILDYNQNAGEIFTTGDSDELGNKLDLLVHGDYERSVNSALEIIREQLSAIKMSEKYQKIYNL